jgi:hypothetical protein
MPAALPKRACLQETNQRIAAHSTTKHVRFSLEPEHFGGHRCSGQCADEHSNGAALHSLSRSEWREPELQLMEQRTNQIVGWWRSQECESR